MAGEGDEIEELAAAGELDRTAATTESLLQMTNLEWGKAACSEDSIKKYAEAGAFRPGELVEWRAAAKDETPKLSTMDDGFVILSLTHIICGLRVDASDFLVSVLEHYKIEWSHLTPNSITVLSIFAHLCEAYMAVPPTLEVFAHFYSLYRNMKGETATLGGAYFRLRDKMKKNYPMYYLRASQFMWLSLWFYAKVPQSCRLTFRGDTLTETNNWKDLLPLSPDQDEQVRRIGQLRKQGLTGINIVRDYLKHQISPLRRRTHLACNYTGPSDPNRDSGKDLSVEEVEGKLSSLLDLRKTGAQPPNRHNVQSILVSASADDQANQPLVFLSAPSILEAKKKAVEEITASKKARKPSMITYKPRVRASLRRYTRQSAGPRKVAVPPLLETDSSPTQGHSDLDDEILDTTANTTNAASPNWGVEHKTIEQPAVSEEGKRAELAKSMFPVIGTKRKASAPRSASQRKAKYSLLSNFTKARKSSLDSGSIKRTSTAKVAVLALNSQPPRLARQPPASLAEEAGSSPLFMLANVVDQTKVVEDSVSHLLNQPVRDSPYKEVDHAQSNSEIVRDQEATEELAANHDHDMEEINSELIWEQMQKLQSEYVSFSKATSSKILEQGKKLFRENKCLKDGQTMLEKKVKNLEGDKTILTERLKKYEHDVLKRIEENTKLTDESKGLKQRIEELSKHVESIQGALVQKCTEVNRHKEEAVQLIKEKEELESRLSRFSDLLKLMSSTLGHGKDTAS